MTAVCRLGFLKFNFLTAQGPILHYFAKFCEDVKPLLRYCSFSMVILHLWKRDKICPYLHNYQLYFAGHKLQV